ncbi:hypothetical protein FQR65_LT18281 [Abscondita terminalis]|nr:hypothetical protein FQR65_LT18281 [Abscondita terminalis]
MNATAKLLDGKNVAEILSLADSIAQKQGIEWASTAPPSLGDMNIFEESKPAEVDPNDIQASAISLSVLPASLDSISGPKALMIIPRLVDAQGNKIEFSNAALETVLEGFYLKLSSLPFDRIMDNSIDVKVSVKTAKKTLQMTKTGISLNPNALNKPVVTEPTEPVTNPDGTTTTPTSPDGTNPPPVAPVEAPKPLGDPKASVSKFIGSIGAKNLKAAYEMSNNPSWGSYESFSNANSGFGAIKSNQCKIFPKMKRQPPHSRCQKTSASEKERFALGGKSAANPGFIGTYNEYSGTKVGKLAAYNAAVLEFKKGNFQKAYDMMDNFSSSNKILMALKYGVMGDCLANLNKGDDALSQFEKAVSASDDD